MGGKLVQHRVRSVATTPTTNDDSNNIRLIIDYDNIYKMTT